MSTPAGHDRFAVPPPIEGAALAPEDAIALAAVYDQLVTAALRCPDPAIREGITGLSAGRAAVAGIGALCGFVAFLAGPDGRGPARPDGFTDAWSRLVLHAITVGSYPRMGGEQ